MEKQTPSTMDIVNRGLARRYRKEKRFKLFGLSAIVVSMLFLVFLFGSITANGWTAFRQAAIYLDITFDEQMLDVENLRNANYAKLIKTSMAELFPDVNGRSKTRRLNKLVSSGAAFELQDMVLKNPTLIGTTKLVRLPADDEVDMLLKGHISRDVPESERRISDDQIGWVDQLVESGRLELKFNTTFFTAGDSREPELSGIKGAIMGSMFTLLITLALSFPIGVSAAVYLEEFAPSNRWTDLIEVNINNLAAVPSIVFGLLGLAVFLNFFGLPRSAPLVGGLVLTLMTLPTIIIASRASLKSVPPSIREAALGVGASKM
jgi:phosphate transport system permease protein